VFVGLWLACVVTRACCCAYLCIQVECLYLEAISLQRGQQTNQLLAWKHSCFWWLIEVAKPETGHSACLN
jgi:hypothetical protein